ncbi:MAG: hypothetical protein JSS27_06970 [Planctomycetes bacterium]|nr:hypothetical protein [Planctomycetota bacterium]
MPTFSAQTYLYGFVLIQVAGLFAGWWARVSEGSSVQGFAQRLFFLCLSLVATLTVLSLSFGPGACISCGATLSVMVLTATWDFSQQKQFVS